MWMCSDRLTFTTVVVLYSENWKRMCTYEIHYCFQWLQSFNKLFRLGTWLTVTSRVYKVCLFGGRVSTFG